MFYSVVPLQKFLCSTNKNLLLESFFNQQELKESNNDLIECIDMIFNQQQKMIILQKVLLEASFISNKVMIKLTSRTMHHFHNEITSFEILPGTSLS